jgi:uncharacterized protein
VNEIKVQHSFSVPVSRNQLWTVLWDIEAVAACIPGCQAVLTKEIDRVYEATIRRKLGPILVGMKLDIQVIERTPQQSVVVAVTGRDLRLKSELFQTLDIQLRDEDGGTHVSVYAALTIDGLLATFSKYLIEMQMRECSMISPRT